MGKLKRYYKKINKPKLTFDEYAKESNIDTSMFKKVEKKPMFTRFVTAAASFILMVAIILPLTLPKLIVDPDTPPPKIYSSQDIISQSISLDEIYKNENLLLFEQTQVMQFTNFTVDFAKENTTLLLGYSLAELLISASDNKNAFYVNFTIRVYHNYEFYSFPLYSDSILTQSFKLGETKVDYTIIQEGLADKKAFLKFTHDNLEYFLEVYGYAAVTDITIDTIKILLGDLIK